MMAGLDIAAGALPLLRQAGSASLTAGARRLGAIAGSLLGPGTAGPARAPVTRRSRVSMRLLQPQAVSAVSPARGAGGTTKGAFVLRRRQPRASTHVPRRGFAAASTMTPTSRSGRSPMEGAAARMLAIAAPSGTAAARSRAKPWAASPTGTRPRSGGIAIFATARGGNRLSATGARPSFLRRSTSVRSGAAAMVPRSPARSLGQDMGPFAPPPAAAAGEAPVSSGSLFGRDQATASGSRAAGGGPDGAAPMTGALHLDGNALGQFVTRHLERALTGAQRGPSGIDPRAIPIWSSASAGF